MWEGYEFCVCECTHKSLTYQEFPNLFYYSLSSSHPHCNYTSFPSAPTFLPETAMITVQIPAIWRLLTILLQNKCMCLAVVLFKECVRRLPAVTHSEGNLPPWRQSGLERNGTVKRVSLTPTGSMTIPQKIISTRGKFAIVFCTVLGAA